MTKKQIYDASTGTSTMVDLTAEEQTAYDNAIAEYNSNPKNNLVNIALEELRFKRNKLLAETDYLGTSDNTMSSAMTTYRQALRDITSGLDTVEKVNTKLETNEDGSWKNFPTKPGE